MDQPTKLRGQIDRVTYHNPENGYTIARMEVKGQFGSITVAGNLPEASAGEMFELTGEWTNHPKYGRQFKIHSCEALKPTSLEGIEKYLGSGIIKGIGPVMARQLVQRFGEKTLEIIDNTPQRLAEVPGIGPKRVSMIQAAWQTQHDIRKVMIFLQGHGVSPAFAVKIYKQYGNEAIDLVTANPYRLSEDIPGVGFKTADKIARNLGVDPNSPARAQAGILHIIQSMNDEGHLFLPYVELIEQCVQILTMDRDIVTKGFSELFEARKIIIEDLNDPDNEFKPNNKAVYLAVFHAAENGVVKSLERLLNQPRRLRLLAGAQGLGVVETGLGITLSPKQKEAVLAATDKKVLVITGGPGTGKTTLIRAVLDLYSRATDKIVLGAPTGRAGKRLSESTGRPAATLHRLLEWDFKTLGFRKGAANPFEADLVIIDEASMIDCLLMHAVLRAVPSHAALILVGDVNQLPSVGPGNVFRDIIASNAVPVVTLDQIFRQAQGSRIVVNAHKINHGEFPETGQEQIESSDFFFVEKQEPEDIQAAVLEMVTRRIPSKFNFDPFRDIQVLTPMHKGVIGSIELNATIQAALNPSGREVKRGPFTFRENDKVMQIRNNYDREVFNGDIGRVGRIDSEEQTLELCFEDKTVMYPFEDLDELVPAYAVSVHKSQGSEYPAIVMPVHTTHFMLLQRNLLYTGLTRAKKLAVLIGTRKALWTAIRNDKPARRYTGLTDKLRTLLQ